MRQVLQWYIYRFRFPHRGLKYLMKWAAASGILEHDFIKPLKNTVRFYCRLSAHIERQILWYDGYEIRETKWLLHTLQSANCFYDIGANIGYYSIQAAKLFPALKVIAFEPSPINCNRLMANVQLNGALPNLQIQQLAVGHTHAVMTLHQTIDENNGMTSLAEVDAALLKSSFQVEVTPLDSWLAATDAPIPDLIKMDIEGAEWLALQGMEKLIDSHHPTLLIELDDRHLQKLDGDAITIVEWLTQKGYKGYQLAVWEELIPLDIERQPIDMAIFKFAGH